MYHSMPITYEEKKGPVKAGECCQSCRRVHVTKRGKLNVKSPGDTIRLYTWAGDPYHSKLDWQFTTTVEKVEFIFFEGGMPYHLSDPKFTVIDGGFLYAGKIKPATKEEIEEIARKDWISPPTYERFMEVLMSLNALKTLDGVWQVITWVPPK